MSIGHHHGNAMNVGDIVRLLTGGRPYVFVIMAYGKKREKVYRIVQDIAGNKLNVACIRADHVPGAGYDLLAKIHDLIRRAELVIAEISEPSPNVYYEIGYAVGIQRLPLLLVEKGKRVPTDLRGLEAIEYENSMDGTEAFQARVSEHLQFRIGAPIPLLRDMLEAPNSTPAYIVTSPKYPGRNSRIAGQVYDSRTFGDHLGILGLISAFGSMRGEASGVELISAKHASPLLEDEDINLYLIGSRKANAYSGTMLKKLLGRQPPWSFDPKEGWTDQHPDWPVEMFRHDGAQRIAFRGIQKPIGKKKELVWSTDYGLIVRGPHPNHHKRIAMIMAGPHSLGTGAACLAATRSSLIRVIKSKLPDGILEDKSKTFWVLVKGTVTERDYLLDEDGVSIEETGIVC